MSKSTPTQVSGATHTRKYKRESIPVTKRPIIPVGMTGKYGKYNLGGARETEMTTTIPMTTPPMHISKGEKEDYYIPITTDDNDSYNIDRQRAPISPFERKYPKVIHPVATGSPIYSNNNSTDISGNGRRKRYQRKSPKTTVNDDNNGEKMSLWARYLEKQGQLYQGTKNALSNVYGTLWQYTPNVFNFKKNNIPDNNQQQQDGDGGGEKEEEEKEYNSKCWRYFKNSGLVLVFATLVGISIYSGMTLMSSDSDAVCVFPDNVDLSNIDVIWDQQQQCLLSLSRSDDKNPLLDECSIACTEYDDKEKKEFLSSLRSPSKSEWLSLEWFDLGSGMQHVTDFTQNTISITSDFIADIVGMTTQHISSVWEWFKNTLPGSSDQPYDEDRDTSSQKQTLSNKKSQLESYRNQVREILKQKRDNHKKSKTQPEKISSDTALPKTQYFQIKDQQLYIVDTDALIQIPSEPQQTSTKKQKSVRGNVLHKNSRIAPNVEINQQIFKRFVRSVSLQSNNTEDEHTNARFVHFIVYVPASQEKCFTQWNVEFFQHDVSYGHINYQRPQASLYVANHNGIFQVKVDASGKNFKHQFVTPYDWSSYDIGVNYGCLGIVFLTVANENECTEPKFYTTWDAVCDGILASDLDSSPSI